MTCEEARLRMADEAGRPAPSAELQGHLDVCRKCLTEAADFRTTWAALGSLPVPEPAPWVSTRFYAALDAYQQGLGERKARWSRWWWQMAISAACLLIGLLGGMRITSSPTADPEVAQLQKEVTSMRQLVALSLLQQQSASERLRGVSWSYQTAPRDPQVLSALLQTVSTDPSPDVRLAAVDALRDMSSNVAARQGLVEALKEQDSPLVQLAIVDALAEIREVSAAPVLRALAGAGDVDENVRKRAAQALKTVH